MHCIEFQARERISHETGVEDSCLGSLLVVFYLLENWDVVTPNCIRKAEQAWIEKCVFLDRSSIHSPPNKICFFVKIHSKPDPLRIHCI